MGGGGGFFAPIIQAIGDVVNTVGGVVGKDNIIDTPSQQKKAAEDAARREQERVNAENARIAAEKQAIIDAENARIAAAKANSDARLQGDALSTMKTASAFQEGGTPTATMSRQANAGVAQSQSQQAVNQSAGSGTLLTGNAGVDPMSLELGRKTLLGG